LLNRRTPASTVVIPLLHRNFTGIHRLLPCQTVVRPARVGATPALFRDTPWPSRESPYLHRGHSSCRFATVSPGGLLVKIRFMPEELRRCPGISRCCFAARCVPEVLNFFKPPGPHPGERWLNTVYPDSMRCLPASLRCGPGVHTVATPGLKSGTV